MADLSYFLIDTPFKDFTLVASDGQKIDVHKCVLYGQSNVFKNIFTDIGMAMENRYETGCEYDALMCAVMWMYGIRPTPWTNEGSIETSDAVFSRDGRTSTAKWHELYVVADKLGIEQMLSSSMYIHYDNQYVARFAMIGKGELDPFYVEERNYDLIYSNVIDTMAYTKYDFDKDEDVSILESLTERMIGDWVRSKLRKNSEYSLV